MVVEKEFLKCYKKGMNDTQISKLYKCDRHAISKLRNKLNLPRMNMRILYGDKIRILSDKGLSDLQISEILDISSSMVGYIRKRLKIKTNFIERTYNTSTDRRKGYMIRNVKYSAKRRGIDFNLNYTDLELPAYCPLLGIKLNYTTRYQDCDHATIDRIDNNLGYIKGNIIVLSRLANNMKNQASFKEIKTFSKNILKLINYYENQGALGSITDVFPDTKMYEET